MPIGVRSDGAAFESSGSSFSVSDVTRVRSTVFGFIVFEFVTFDSKGICIHLLLIQKYRNISHNSHQILRFVVDVDVRAGAIVAVPEAIEVAVAHVVDISVLSSLGGRD